MKVAFLGTYPPRECGIATFTQDLVSAINKEFNPKLVSQIIAMNDEGSFYNYNPEVKHQINQNDVEDYINTAKDINSDSEIELVNVQHEFGLFGGEYGEYLLPFLETLEKPVMVTFHSVLPNPEKKQKKVVRAIAERAKGLVVMADSAIDILSKDYGISKRKIHKIHHGVPDIEIDIDKEKLKKELRVDGRFVLATFGLLSRGKGIEYAIKALPNVVKQHPEILYIVIGETHPQVRKHEGESYRNELEKLVKKLKLEKNVKFYNKYLSLNEIIQYLQAADVYITPSLDPNQIVSGTLSYAVSSGTPVIATKYAHAKELISNDKGFLVDFKKPKQIEAALKKLVNDNELREQIGNNAYQYGRKMVWKNVANDHMKAFKKSTKKDRIRYSMPDINFNHLKKMTDSTGIIQHAKHSIPERKTGYTLDDNARALIAVTKYYDLTKNKKMVDLITIYLAFIKYMQKEDGNFHTTLSYDHSFVVEPESDDSYGRAIWACGVLVNSSVYENITKNAKFIMDNALKRFKDIKSPRAMAFIILGLVEYYKKFKSQDLKDKIIRLADKLVEAYESESSEDWKWFEAYLTYSNGVLPEAMFEAYEITRKNKYLDVAKNSLDFLKEVSIIDGKIVLVGHNGWYKKNGKRALYDQQPVDASCLVRAFLAAYKATKKRKYYNDAVLSFEWFLGNNSLNKKIYDEETGGCFDGLNPGEINLNQGAESTISYIIARLYIEEIKNKKI
jgi:glycosyltransferase involved in cell wall biosynthesis